MRKLVFAICLAATPSGGLILPAAAQNYQPPDNDREHRDRDRSEWRQEQNRQEDEQRQYNQRDHSDDEPDVMLIASGKHYMRKAGGEQRGSGGGAGKIRVNRTGPHFLNPQPLPPG
jgi:Ni/Co efflux regulator RcnB